MAGKQIEICERCGKRPVQVIRRHLCRGCYNTAVKKKEKFPPLPTLRHSNTFSLRKITKKYGPEMFADLKRAATKPFFNLTDIARKYGITREMARQIFKMTYGKDYKVFAKAKAREVKEELASSLPCNRHPLTKVAISTPGSCIHIGATVEADVMERCKEFGFDVKPGPSLTIDLCINGYMVEVKSRGTARKTVRTEKAYVAYCQFSLTKNQNGVCDFVICKIPDGTFYVVPAASIGSNGIFNIPTTGSRYKDRGGKYHHSPYRQYKEAWYLLTPKLTA